MWGEVSQGEWTLWVKGLNANEPRANMLSGRNEPDTSNYLHNYWDTLSGIFEAL